LRRVVYCYTFADYCTLTEGQWGKLSDAIWRKGLLRIYEDFDGRQMLS